MNCVRRTKLLSTLLLVAALLPIRAAEAQTYTVIHNFNGLDGGGPQAGVIGDGAGNLYGTAGGGTGTNCLGQGCGVIYQMTNVSGSWTEHIIYQFQGNDGEFQYGPAALDSNGNVFATAWTCTAGCLGTVVEASPHNGGWAGTVLHRFTGRPDGSSPSCGLLFDSGTLYGVAETGGLYDAGSAFTFSGPEYTNYSQIYSFTGLVNSNGEFGPASMTPVRDANGNLYGTTAGIGTVWASIFELIPNGHGGWNEKALYRFNNSQQGTTPFGGVVIGPDGNLYGTTYSNGPFNSGVVYQLAHNANGTWSYNVIYAFQGGNDGGFPSGAPRFDAAGNLYGTTEWGGNGSGGYGTVFKLTPSNHGEWTKTILYRFADPAFGANPQYSQLWLDTRGNIYGTTISGGSNGDGVVFEITP